MIFIVVEYNSLVVSLCREVDGAVPMDTTLMTLARFPRMLIRTSPETFLWGVSRDQLHDVVTCGGHAATRQRTCCPGRCSMTRSGRTNANEAVLCVTRRQTCPDGPAMPIDR